jgi:hypothetical protein
MLCATGARAPVHGLLPNGASVSCSLIFALQQCSAGDERRGVSVRECGGGLADQEPAAAMCCCRPDTRAAKVTRQPGRLRRSACIVIQASIENAICRWSTRSSESSRLLWRNPLRMDNARLEAVLGREPHTPLEAAVAATLEGLGCLAPAAVPFRNGSGSTAPLAKR